MNMHGVIEPAVVSQPERASAWSRLSAGLWQRRMFLLIVVVPTLLTAAYLYLYASDQYESEAHYLVRTADAEPMPAIGVNQVLSAATGISSGQNEGMSVADFLTSHDVVAVLRRQDHFVQRFHRSDADILSRLWSADPTPEHLLRYYRRQVRIQYNTETGITTLSVRSFRPQDSYELVSRLLQLGEARVNELNTRSYNDSIASAKRQLEDAERDLGANQTLMANFRQTREDIDPQASGEAQIGLVKSLDQQLAVASAQLNAMGGLIDRRSPQYAALEKRVQALRDQVGHQSRRLVGTSRSIANDIGGYEDLKLRQQFLSKRYDAAATALQRAREQAQRQQLYVVRVVDPNMPVKALYPQRARIVATVLVALLLIYSIGWLLVAGVREHAA